MCPRQRHRSTDSILCSHLVSSYLKLTAWSALSLIQSVRKQAKIAVCATVVINLIEFQKKHREAHGLLLDLIFVYSITMAGFFSVVLAVKWECLLTCLHKKLLEQWLKKTHARQALLLLMDMLMEVWYMFQGPGSSLRPNPSSIKIEEILVLVCPLELLLEQMAHFQIMAVMEGKFWQAVSIPQRCLLIYSCL